MVKPITIRFETGWCAVAVRLMAVLLLGGCAHSGENTPPVGVCPESSTASVLTTLFFGRSMPGGGQVSESQWNAFVANEISARFPGFTVLSGEGYWQKTAEKSKIVLIAHHKTNEELTSITDLAQSYTRSFFQESVLRIDQPGCVSFIGQ